MFKRIATGAAVGVAALGLLSLSTPATAENGVTVFTGTANTNPGLNYPTAQGQLGSWSFSFSGVGVGEITGAGTGSGSIGGGSLFAGVAQEAITDNLGPLDLPGADALIEEFDDGAFCGASGGSSGSGAIVNTGSSATKTTYIKNARWAQSAASLIVFEGEAYKKPTKNTPNGFMNGLVVAVPDVAGGQSCANATGSTVFTVVGVAAVSPANV